MLKSIEKEIFAQKNYLGNIKVTSIYFGGGTPSVLTSMEIKRILKNIYKTYNVNDDPEITIECNPDDLTSRKLSSYKNSGINRLSIGVQSFNDRDLKFMNRSHTAKKAIQSIEIAKKNGFENISIDLIYGLPNQTLKKWGENLEIMFGLNIQHFSAYCLTIEKKTALYHLVKKKKVQLLEDKKIIDQFNLLQNKAKKRGFIHYEISNFGIKGYFSKHNTSYWKGTHYLGLGPSAHSYNGKSRRWNIRSNTKYISRIKSNANYFEEEELTVSQQYNEYVFTSLRTIWGLDASIIKNRFGNNINLHFNKEIVKWEEKKYVTCSKNNYTLTTLGKRFADAIASDLFII